VIDLENYFSEKFLIILSFDSEKSFMKKNWCYIGKKDRKVIKTDVWPPLEIWWDKYGNVASRLLEGEQ
jgi:hypothetical protein